jgi:hypothetical protein
LAHLHPPQKGLSYFSGALALLVGMGAFVIPVGGLLLIKLLVDGSGPDTELVAGGGLFAAWFPQPDPAGTTVPITATIA